MIGHPFRKSAQPPQLSKRERQQLISELVERNAIHSQEQLLDLLMAENVMTTQATLSRDLKELGIAKGPGGYEVHEPSRVLDERYAPLADVLQRDLLSVQQGGNIIVLQTRNGQARTIVQHMEQIGLPHVLGVVADDGTAFLAARTVSQGAALVRMLRTLSGRR